MTSGDTTGHNAGDPGSVESWLVSAGRDRRPGSPLNVPPFPASNFVLGERRAYSRDDGTPGWEALEEIVGGLEGGSSVSFASGMAGIAAVFDQLLTGSVVPGRSTWSPQTCMNFRRWSPTFHIFRPPGAEK